MEEGKFKCKNCGNENEFTIWRPVAEYNSEAQKFEDAFMPKTDEMKCDICDSTNIEEL